MLAWAQSLSNERELSDTFPLEHNGHSIFDGEEVAKAYADPTAMYRAVVLDSSDIGAKLL